MSRNKFQQLYTFLCFILLHLCFLHQSKAYNTFIYAGCSQDKYQPNSAFEANLNSFLTSDVSSSSQSLYNSFTLGTQTSTSEGALYGLYQCRGDLQLSDCAKCIQTAVSQIGLVCPNSYGATLQLDACYVRYEHFDFIGKLDSSLMYKRCSSKSESYNDEDFFRRRDEVLSDIQSASSGGFKIRSSGLIQGISQCLGDLNGNDCGMCLADAVGKLKTLCGSAVAAHVFLNKCFAQYWESGYYDLNSASDTNNDDVGKTVAIIVGIIGGLAVFIVLLAICKRAVG